MIAIENGLDMVNQVVKEHCANGRVVIATEQTAEIEATVAYWGAQSSDKLRPRQRRQGNHVDLQLQQVCCKWIKWSRCRRMILRPCQLLVLLVVNLKEERWKTAR